MKKFRLPKWQQDAIKRKEQRQHRVVNSAIDAMSTFMEFAVDSVLSNYNKTGTFVPPSLSEISLIMRSFYKGVLEGVVYSSEEMKSEQSKKKKLARKIDVKSIFNNSRYWSRIMKRSDSLSKSLQSQYLKKLRDRFNKLMPLIHSGDVSPAEAKKEMMNSWKATKSRAETIFRTESTKYYADAQLKFFKNDPEIVGFMFDALIDQSVTKICRSRHGLVYRPDTELLKKNTPPCHYNCRSHLIPLADTEENRRMLKDPSRDPAKRRVEPLPVGWK